MSGATDFIAEFDPHMCRLRLLTLRRETGDDRRNAVAAQWGYHN